MYFLHYILLVLLINLYLLGTLKMAETELLWNAVKK